MALEGVKNFGRYFLGLRPYDRLPTLRQRLLRWSVRLAFAFAIAGGYYGVSTRQAIDVQPSCTAQKCVLDITGKNTNFRGNLTVKAQEGSGIKVIVDQASLRRRSARVFLDLSDARPGVWDVDVNQFHYEDAVDLRAAE